MRRAVRPSATRVRTPTVMQMEATECGAAALGIVLAYYGRFVPLEQLRVECGVSRDGSKASNVVKAARRHGMLAEGYGKEPGELAALGFPLIVFWNFTHFLVVEGIGPKRVWLNDPATGPRTVSIDEFDHGFTGIALAIQPGPDFERGQSKPTLWRALLPRLSSSRAGLLFLALVSLALVVPGLLGPVFNRVFVDNYLVAHRDYWVRPLLVAMAAVVIVRAALTWLQQSSLLRLENKLAVAGSGSFFWHVLRLPTEFFAQRFAGDISSRVQINDQVGALIAGDLGTQAISALLAAFYAVMMFQYDVVLTLVGVAAAAGNLAVLAFIARRRKDQNIRRLQDHGRLMGASMEGLQTIETLKAAGAEQDFFERWSGYQARLVNAEQRLALSSQVLAVVPPLLAAVSTALILALGAVRVMDGLLTMGMLIAFQALTASFIEPTGKLVDLAGKLQEADGDLARLDDVLRYPIDSAFGAAHGDDEEADGDLLDGYVELRDVTFGYSRLEPPLIEHFDLKLAPGDRVALVGSSGSGKSTIAKLVTGLYEPWEGQVLFDGHPRASLPRRVITNSLAAVDQDIALFEGTIHDNIAMWDRTLPPSQITDAGRDACIHDDISSRAGGYDHQVEEGGQNFSGGQRQRLEIARALATNPRILVLDEATSALDAVTENTVDDSIRRRGCTCLIIAHRLSTIRDCDEIVVLQDGKVVERGTHVELMARGGAYAGLIRSE